MKKEDENDSVSTKNFRIIVRCEKDPYKHAKILEFQFFQVDGARADVGREYCETLAGLLDGTSKHYIFPPNEGSPIGRCDICRGKLTAVVTEVEKHAATKQ